MTPVTKAYLQLHASILLAGWTGIFGKLITLSPGLIVFWRIVIAGGLLWLVTLWRKTGERVAPRDRAGLMAVGALLMLQWTLFYASIKASSVSIGVVAFSSIGFFTALLEPLFARRPLRFKEVGLSLLTILGIGLIFGIDIDARAGIAFGTASALGAALLAIFFKHYRTRYGTNACMRWQLAGGSVAALAALPAYRAAMPPEALIPSAEDAACLIVFATACTLGMYMLQIQALEYISPFVVNLSYNLEPVYSILLAMLLFGEAREMGPAFAGGVALILASVALQTFGALKEARRAQRLAAGRRDTNPTERLS